MFKKILVPMDLSHLDALQPGLTAAADLARHYGAEVCYFGVTATTPGTLARTPQEYHGLLEAFANEQAQVHGQTTSAHSTASPDPVADVDDAIVDAIAAVNADLVVMATHLPKHLDAVVPSHGTKVASSTDVSVFLVRQ